MPKKHIFPRKRPLTRDAELGGIETSKSDMKNKIQFNTNLLTSSKIFQSDRQREELSLVEGSECAGNSSAF